MPRYDMIDYRDIDISKEVLTSFANAIASEIKAFYDSSEGQAYFAQWLAKHPEYNQSSTAA